MTVDTLISDYEIVLEDHRRLVKELDVLLNGVNAAEQASLCDIVSQVKKEGIRPSSAPGHYLTDEQIREAFGNNTDCYADTWKQEGSAMVEGDVVPAMTVDTFVSVVSKLIKH